MEGDVVVDGSTGSAGRVAAMVDALIVWLRTVDRATRTGHERLTVLGELQRMSNAVAGAQARVTAGFAEEQRRSGASARGVAAEVAFARKVGLSRGQRLVAAATTLVDDLPETMAALERGDLPETRAVIVAEGVSLLEPAAREVVDDSLVVVLDGLADGELREAVATAAAGVDPELVERRRQAALRERRVTVRPGSDGMAWLSIYTTLADAAAAESTLRQYALPDEEGDRSLGERMAEAAIARMTGRTPHRGPVVEIQLVVTDRTLFARPGTPGREEPARIVGGGMVPAQAARDLVRPTRAPRPGTRTDSGRGPAELTDLFEEHEERRVSIRRLALGPGTRELVGIDRHRRPMPALVREVLVGGGTSSTTRMAGQAVAGWREYLARSPDPPDLAPLETAGRRFTGVLRQFVLVRDRVCRAPWCSAPVRHLDHARPHRAGGPTSAVNAQGLCVAHNLAKEDDGWSVLAVQDSPHLVVWRTPCGLTRTSQARPVLAPRLPDPVSAMPTDSPLEARLRAFLLAA